MNFRMLRLNRQWRTKFTFLILRTKKYALGTARPQQISIRRITSWPRTSDVRHLSGVFRIDSSRGLAVILTYPLVLRIEKAIFIHHCPLTLNIRKFMTPSIETVIFRGHFLPKIDYQPGKNLVQMCVEKTFWNKCKVKLKWSTNLL